MHTKAQTTEITAGNQYPIFILDTGEYGMPKVKANERSNPVNESDEARTEIVDGVKKANAIVEEISSASKEHPVGLDHVGTAIGAVNAATQEYATLLEHTLSLPARNPEIFLSNRIPCCRLPWVLFEKTKVLVPEAPRIGNMIFPQYRGN